jgi:hypothetical protein
MPYRQMSIIFFHKMDGVVVACVFFERHNLMQYTQGGHKEMPLAILDDQ